MQLNLKAVTTTTLTSYTGCREHRDTIHFLGVLASKKHSVLRDDILDGEPKKAFYRFRFYLETISSSSVALSSF